MANIPYQLHNCYQSGRLIPFVGAGISMSVKWTEPGPPPINRRGPSWAELVDKAATDLGFQVPALARSRGTDLQILEYYQRKLHSFARLTHWLHSAMQPPDDALKNSLIHRELVKFKTDFIYTTNFDNFIERSFDLLGRPYKPVCVEADMANTNGKCEIVKFHGDLDHPDAMVVSESDYDKRLSFSTPMDFRLRSDLLNRALLFLGYSFRDHNVSYLFRIMNDTLGKAPSGSMNGPRAYITVPDASEFELELFRARSIEVIPISGVRMTEDIAEFLSELRT